MLRLFIAMVMLTAVSSAQAQVSPSAIYEGIDKTLTATLAKPYSGDVDVDFLTRMMAQHDAAIERAKAVLANSTDAKVRMMAGDMMKTLHADQRVMKEWLNLHGPKQIAAEPAPLPKALPQTAAAVITTTEKMRVAVTLPVSPSLVVTSTLPPVDVISATIAKVDIVSLSEIIPQAMPELPAHDAEIENTAPKMEFLDGGQ